MNGPTLPRLAWISARDVTLTLGGGFAAMELLRRTLRARGWMDSDSHALMIAVSRLTPGTNILAYCVAMGWLFHRFAGSAIALLGASLPASLIVFAVTAALVRLDEYRTVRILLALGMLAGSALVLSSAWHLLRPYWAQRSRWRAAWIFVVALGLFALDLTPVRVLLIAAVLGFLMPGPVEARHSPAESAGDVGERKR